MKINVTENKVSIKEEQILNENEYNIHKIQFDFSSEYTNDLVKVALFSIDNHTYKKIISNDECDIPPEVLTQRGYSILGVYAYKTEQDTLVLRYSPSPTKISVYDGSYKADAENSEPITPSEIEQYQQILQNSLQQFQNQYNALVEETEGDIQAIEDELQRKVDEGYFDGEDGFSPIAKVIQKSNGATIEIEDKNGKTTADVLNGKDGYTPVRGVDYWTEEDKQEVEEEATQQIEGKIEEYNENAAEKLNQYNQNSVQKTNDYNTNAEQKMSAYNSNATEKFNDYNSNAEQKETNYNTNASQKVESFNTNASSKLSEYNSNAETKKSAYDENATQKTSSFNTNATNKLTEYNTNHTEKMNAYNSNNTEKINAFNENATQKTEDFDEHTEEIQDNIEILQRTDNQILSRFNKDEEVSGQDITLTGTTEIKFAKPPLPMGNSEQESTEGKQLLPYPYVNTTKTENGITFTDNGDGSITINGTAGTGGASFFLIGGYSATDNMPETLKTILSIQATGQSDVVIQSSFTESEYNVFANNQVVNKDWSNVTGGYIRILVRDGVSTNNLKVKPYFVKGTYTAQTFPEYEKYTGGEASPNPQFESPITNVTGDVEVKVQNKNLFNYDDFENKIQTFTTNGDSNSFTINGYATYQYPISLKGQHVISGKWNTTNLNGDVKIIYEDDTSDNLLSSYTSSSANGNINLITSNSKNVKAIQFRTFSTNNLTITNFQIEEGSTSTPYTPHKEQVFTFPLGNEKLMLGDYLADDGIHHVRKQVVLDGSENWGNLVQIGTSNYYRYENVDFRTNNCLEHSTYLSDKFIYNTNTMQQANVIGNSNAVGANRLWITIDTSLMNGTTINDFKTWLSTHNVTVEYELEEEVIVPYTSAQQRVYNEIKNAYSYDEITIITGSSDGNKPFFIVQAYKDLNKELNNKVDKVQGKELSSNDFTDTLKEKLEGLENYDDTEIKADISDIQEENARLKATLPTTGEVTGQDITLDKTAELEFIKPPLPMGNSEQVSTTGKQKFNKSINSVLNVATTQIELETGKRITCNQNTSETTIFSIFAVMDLSSYVGSTIRFKSNFKSSSTNTGRYYIGLCDSSGNNRTQKDIATISGTELSFVVPELSGTQTYLCLVLYGSFSASVSLNDYVDYTNMILTIDNSDMTYEPYTGGTASPNPDYPQEITNVTGDVEVKVQNKNLFDKTTIKSGKSVSATSGGLYSDSNSFATDYIYIKGIQKLRGNGSSASANTNRLWGAFYDENKSYISGLDAISKAITVPNNAYYVRFGVLTTYLDTFMLCIGETVPEEYITHKSQILPLTLGNIELCKIGDYQDYFYKESNKWYLHKEIEKVIFDGSESWNRVMSTNNAIARFGITTIDYLKGLNTGKIPTFMSNYFIPVNFNTVYDGISGGISWWWNDNIKQLILCLNDDRSLENFKTWLSTHNTIVYYVLETPTDTEITDTTLISQLEAISNAISYEEQTNIRGSSNGSNPIFTVEGYQSTKLILQNIDSRLTLVEG